MSAESSPDLPVGFDRDTLKEIASDRGILPDRLTDLLTNFQEHWTASDFLDEVATPRGARPGMWYLTVPADDWKDHVQELDAESYEWLAVRDVYLHVYRDWESTSDTTHTLTEAETPVIFGREDSSPVELSVPAPTSSSAVDEAKMSAETSTGDDKSSLAESPEGADDTDQDDAPATAVGEAEWEIQFGLTAMEYGTHARATATITGPAGTLTVRRDCYAHPRTATGEDETPPGKVRLETTRTHEELDATLPADPTTVSMGERVSQDSMELADVLITAHVEALNEDYTALVNSVDVCGECGGVPNPEEGVYVATILPLDGAYCWECFGEVASDSDTIRISQRQAESRFLRAVGLSYGAIGKMLGVQTSSVTTHLDRAAKSRKKAADTLAVFEALESVDEVRDGTEASAQ